MSKDPDAGLKQFMALETLLNTGGNDYAKLNASAKALVSKATSIVSGATGCACAVIKASNGHVFNPPGAKIFSTLRGRPGVGQCPGALRFVKQMLLSFEAAKQVKYQPGCPKPPEFVKLEEACAKIGRGYVINPANGNYILDGTYFEYYIDA